jgi:D-beta-D-heptose 7-phosphate kinase/D-beta-D-heptose 1-phosphate adenosyltransferase
MRIQIPNFDNTRVLVIGDVMLDRYWHGPTSRISPEAPVPVVRIEQREDRPGGAGNVALNIVTLGARVTLIGLIGDDDAGRILSTNLASAGIDSRLRTTPGYTTVTKLRVLSRHQQLIRLDVEGDVIGLDRLSLLDAYTAALAQADVVVLSDYGKGALRNSVDLIRLARAAGKQVLVDPKGGDFSIYRNASIITPNLAAFEAVVGPCRDEAEIVNKGMELMRAYAFDALLVTRGEQGMTLLRTGETPLHLPARAREVYDVTGAGDTVIGVLAAGLAAGSQIPAAAALANLAASLVVGKLGAASVSVAELHAALHGGHAGGSILGEDPLLLQVQAARAQGDTIVMTNGCFDLLHAGHVSYLERARRLGHRLVVAVNDDASVRRLKGVGRPVNPLKQRMAVLAGLAAVDWVVPFSEESPERLIGRVAPDVLVKGGDYRPQQIAGHDSVTRAGGQVVVLALEAGCSTSSIIDSIRARPQAADPAKRREPS